MASRLRDLIVRISADSSIYEREMQRAARTGESYYKTIEQGSRRTNQAMRSQIGDLSDLNNQLGRVKSAATIATGALAGAFAIGNLTSVADDMNNITARLRMASSSTQEFQKTYKSLLQISQDTGSSFHANADLFARSASSLEEFGFSAEQTIEATSALSKGLILSGASAEETTSAITQFAQAMEQGVLRGQEYNTLNVTAGRVMQALAEGLGVARKDLKAMADQGQLTVDRVIPAIISQLGKLTGEVQKMPRTVAGSMNRIKNAFGDWVYGANEASGATATLTDGLNLLAGNIGNVANVTLALGAGGLIKYLTSVGASSINAAKSQAALYTSTVATAAAQRDAAVQTVRKIAAEREATAAALVTARNEVTATQGTNAHAAALQNLSRARAASISSSVAHANALKGEASAQAALTSATSVTGKLGAGLLGLAGGIPGVVALVGSLAAGMYLFSRSAQDATGSNADLSSSLDDLQKKFAALSPDQQAGEIAEFSQRARDETVKAGDALNKLQNKILKMELSASGNLMAGIPGDPKQFNQLVKFSKALDDARDRGVALSSVIQEFAPKIGLDNDAIDSWNSLAKAYADSSEAASKATARQSQLQNSFTGLINSITGIGDAAKRSIIDVTKLNAELGNGPSDAAIKKYEGITSALKEQLASIQDSSVAAATARKLDQQGITDKGLRDQAQALARQVDAAKAAGEARREAEQKSQQAARQSQQAAQQAKQKQEQLLRSYEQTTLQMQRQIDLGENATNVQQTLWEIQNGELGKFNRSQQQNLINLSRELDAHEAINESIRRQADFQRYVDNAAAERASQKAGYTLDTISVSTGGNQLEQLRREQDIRQRYIEERRRLESEAANPENTSRSAEYERYLEEARKNYEIELSDYRESRTEYLAAQGDWINGIRSGWDDIEARVSDQAGNTNQLLSNTFDSVTDSIANLVTNGKLGFKDLARSVVADVTKMTSQLLIMRAIQASMGWFGGGNAVASVAGSINLPGMSSFHLGAHADGGMIKGPGTGTSDSIMARLSNGEFVVNAGAVAQPGVRAMLESLNATRAFASGGYVSGSPSPTTARLSSGALANRNSNLAPSVEIHNNGEPVRVDSAEFSPEQNRMILRLVADNIVTGGDVHKATRSTFNLKTPGR